MPSSQAGLRASILLLMAVGATAACGSGPEAAPNADSTPGTEGAAGPEQSRGADPLRATDPTPNTLSDQERADGWRLLFDGRSLEGWRGFRRDEAPDGWRVEDGTLTVAAPAGDLITEDQFADFELSLEWMVEPGGNSGVFLRATEEVEFIYFGAPEMQILDDDGHPDGQSRQTAAGSNFDLHPAPEGVVRPAEEWNHFRIVVDGARVEQWMNGVRVVAYELWSPEWEELVAASKFADWPEYGRAREGHIGLQDHGDRVWFRNLKIREIR